MTELDEAILVIFSLMADTVVLTLASALVFSELVKSTWFVIVDPGIAEALTFEGFDLVPISRALNSYVNIFNIYGRFWTNSSSI